MNIAKAFTAGAHPSTLGMLQSWENEEGVHTPSGSKTPIVICGWLLKMKREHRKFGSAWNRRWFTVEDGALHWYKTASSDTGGRLSLVNITSVRKFEGSLSYTFIVHAADRDMLLRADSANDVGRWIRGLTLQIDLVHGGTFQGPPSAKNRRRTVLRMTGDSGTVMTNALYHRNAHQQQLSSEHSHFREINDRIKAIMGDRDEDVDTRTRHVSPAPERARAYNCATSTRSRRETSAASKGRIGRGQGGSPISVSIVQAFEVTPRPSRGSGSGASSARIVPAGTPSRSPSPPQRSPDPRSMNFIDDGARDFPWVTCENGLREGGNAVDTQTRSRPPPPKDPPPTNWGGRRSTTPNMRSAPIEDRREFNASSGRNQRAAITDVEDNDSDHEHGSDIGWRTHVASRNSARGGGRAAVRRDGLKGAGASQRGMSSRQTGSGNKLYGGFAALDGVSPDQSNRMTDDTFMDEYHCGDTARSFRDREAGGPSPNVGKTTKTRRSRSSRESSHHTNKCGVHHRKGVATTGNKTDIDRSRRSHQHGGRYVNNRGNSDDCDDRSEDKNDSSDDSLVGGNGKAPAKNRSKNIRQHTDHAFTNDSGGDPGFWPAADSGKEGYTGGGGTKAASGYPETGGGVDTSGWLRSQSGNSGGSITAEESWSCPTGRGPESDTTSSRLGSSQLPSSRSGSRQASSRPARRYLVQQNRFH